MKNILNFIEVLEHTALASISDTLSLSAAFGQCYSENDTKLINPLVDAHLNEKLKENAHSRILYSLLKGSDFVKTHFLNYFLRKKVSLANITIPNPDTNRIDLTIKGADFYLIIENKVNGAQEQEKQIDRYVKKAGKTYPKEQIYVLYLNKDGHAVPSESSLSPETKMQLGDNLIIQDYRHDVLKWLYSVNDKIAFDTDPQLKSAIVVYIGYLEEYFQTSERQKIMNNKLDNLIKEHLKLENKTTSDKLKVIEDELTNLDKLKERLEEIQEQYQNDYNEKNFETWYKESAEQIDDNITLTRKSRTEFGFDFKYSKLLCRCMLAVDEVGYYWGIKCDSEKNSDSDSDIEYLRNSVLNSRSGFHNYEGNSKEWVVSDYASENEIVGRFVTLTSIIANNEKCTIL